MANECALCGDFAVDHEANLHDGQLFYGRCRARNYYGSGPNDWTRCECPHFEPVPERQEATT